MVRITALGGHLCQRDADCKGYHGNMEWYFHQALPSPGDSGGRSHSDLTQRGCGCCRKQYRLANWPNQPSRRRGTGTFKSCPEQGWPMMICFCRLITLFLLREIQRVKWPRVVKSEV